MKRLYIAYGSNLNVRQMKTRCPNAKILGTAKLKGWELLFKGSKSGSYLTIEKKENAIVPVVIWEVDKTDEKALDRYEGYPTFYYKKDIKVQYKGIRTGNRRTVTAFAYIMHEERQTVYQAFSTSTPALTVTIPFILTSRYFSMPITSQRSCTKMTDNLVQLRTCPRCGGVYSGHGAVSRADNLTVICPDCGTREALESIGVDEKEQEKILDTIHRCER